MSLIKRKKTPTLSEGSTFFEILYEICFFLLLVGYFLFYDTRSLQLIFVGIGLGGTLLLFIGKAYESRLKLPLNTIWYLLFFVLAEVSAWWAHSPDNTVNRYFRLMVTLIAIGFGITQYVSTTHDAEKLFKIFVFFTFVVSVAQLIFTPVSDWADGFVGSQVGGHNANTFGFVVSFASLISFYFAYIKKIKPFYLFTLFFILCCFLTSSRKAVTSSCFSIMLCILLAFKRKHHLLHFALGVGAAFFAAILILVDDTLYQLIGYRFDSLFQFLSTGSTQDESSIILRTYFIQFAQSLFAEKPILGQGFANFAIILSIEGDVNKEVYAHNNYWEILADLGIVGFIVYYWFYLYMFFKLIVKSVREKSNSLNVLAIIMLISLFILEWGVVSMASFYPQIVVSMIYICSYASNSQRKFHYSPTANVR